MGFFKNIGKAIGKVGNVVGKVVKTVAPVAAIVPGVGTAVAAAAGITGELLSPTKQEAIVEAVQEQQVVKVDKIEKTIVNDNPSIDAASLQAAVTQMTSQALAAAPTAKIDDSKSSVNIAGGTKLIQWLKSNALLVVAGVAGLFLILKPNGGRRSYRR